MKLTEVLHRLFTLLLIVLIFRLTDYFTDIHFTDYKNELMFMSGWWGLIIYEELFLKLR